MNITQRRLYMLSFVTTFFLTAPILVFLAKGYSFDRIGGVFVHNGAITIKSNPKKVDLYLDDKKISNKMLNIINNYYVINGVRFGNHVIEARKDGYTTWKKKIDVHSGVSTEFWNILLFPTTNKTLTTHSPQDVKQFYLSPRQDDELVLYKEQDGKKIISIFTTNDGLENVIYSTTAYVKLIPDKNENVEWSSNHKKLLIPALTISNLDDKISSRDTSEQKDYIAINLKNSEQQAVSLLDILSTINLSTLKVVNDKIIDIDKTIKELLPEDTLSSTTTSIPTSITPTKSSIPKKPLNTTAERKTTAEQDVSEKNTPIEIYQARWMFDSENLLLLTKNHQLFFINMENPTQSSLLANNVNGFDLAGDHVYYSDLTDNLIWDIKPGKADYKQPISIIHLNETTDSFIKVFAYDELRIALITSSKNLYTLNRVKPKDEAIFKLIESNVLGVQFSDDGKKLLYWTDKDFWVYMLRKWDKQPKRDKDEKIFITNFSSGVKNIQWMEAYENILFTNNNLVKSAELDNRDQINSSNVLKINSAPKENNFIYNKETSILYFLDNQPNTQNLQLNSIKILEKTGLFGLGN
jgi:hypothetical protein